MVYQQYVNQLNISVANVKTLEQIPFLPISFFKTHAIKTGMFEPDIIFESSGTTSANSSRHFIRDIQIYRQSFLKTFQLFYGQPKNWCIIAMLPSYVERKNSSLVFMVDELIKASGHPLSDFYLNDNDKLYQAILHNEIRQQPTLIFGVTFALLDFAETHKLNLAHTVILETGGMKGRRTELTRTEVHQLLQTSFGKKDIHSEYSMAELLSQAYAKKDGVFSCPPWMKILLREEDDPLEIHNAPPRVAKPVSGLINIIDLANIHSCSFIATDDVGRLYANGTFEVLGRADASEIRGCSQLVV